MTISQKLLCAIVTVVAIHLVPLDAAARFISVDPHKGMYPTVSPYIYANNNPLLYVDPDGRGPVAASVRAARRTLEKKLMSAARRKAVRRAWAIEKERIARGLEPRLNISDAEAAELLKTGKIAGWEGHHINSVSANDLESAIDPNNIKFVKGRAEHLKEHGGDFKKETSGPLIDRLTKLGGPGLLAFFMAYDAKLQQLLGGCAVCSDDDAWHSWINPWNAILENIALTYGFAAAERARDEQKDDGVSVDTPSNSHRFDDD